MEQPTNDDAIPNAIWASEAFGTTDTWDRVRTAVINTQWVGDRILLDEKRRLSWAMDSLEASLELRQVGSHEQIVMSVSIFTGFESEADATFLANNLNYKAVGGAFSYDPSKGTLSFASYCATAVWWDFALVLLLFRIACGQAEMLSRRVDICTFNKCSAATTHRRELLNGQHSIVTQRLWDSTQMDFVAGLWISERERDHLITEMMELQDEFDVHFLRDGDELKRNIDSIDFFLRIPPPEGQVKAVLGFASPGVVRGNEWTDFGRAISVHIGLPYFTVAEAIDEKYSEQEAIDIANMFNRISSLGLWEKLGVGTWYAVGAQVCFSRVIPHAVLKPILYGIHRFEIGELLCDLLDPRMVGRSVQAAIRELDGVGMKSAREPGPEDSIFRASDARKRPELCRVDNSVLAGEEVDYELWQFPSNPVLVYGIFNPVGSTMGSIEVVTTQHGSTIVNRIRHPHVPGEEELAFTSNADELPGLLSEAVASLCDRASLPHFVYVPEGLSAQLREALQEAVEEMARRYGSSGIDVGRMARFFWTNPNPWGRTQEVEDAEIADVPEFSEMMGEQAYAGVVTYPPFLDFNIGLFQAWWEGAIAWVNNPDAPDDATRAVEQFMQHTFDRMTGPANQD